MAKPNSSDFDLLIKVVKDLEDFLPHLVLVGGWVPFLYVRFLWEETTQDPLMTMDIDFGLRNMAFKGKETIAQRVIKKNYGEHHLEIGKDVPFVPIVQSKKGARADVEFISDENTPEDVRRKLVGREIQVNTLEFVNVLLEKTISVNLKGIQINVPDPSQYVFHKLLTFADRTPESKKGKDLYYAYFVLRFHPDAGTFSKTVSKLIQSHLMGKTAKKNIRDHFEDAHAVGPALIFEATKMSSLATLGIDIQKDAFERIQSLIKNG